MTEKSLKKVYTISINATNTRDVCICRNCNFTLEKRFVSYIFHEKRIQLTLNNMGIAYVSTPEMTEKKLQSA